MKTLEPLECLVQELFKTLPQKNDLKWLDNVHELITIERNRATQTIRETIYHLKGDQGRKSAHIEFLQTEISKISDGYFGLVQEIDEATPEYLLINALLSALNQIYQYLKETYASAFNDQLKIPLALKHSFAAENQKMTVKITRALTASGEDKVLVKLIGDYLNVLSKPVYRPVHNSRELDYHNSFVISLYRLVNNHTGAELRKRFFPELIHLNFNYFPVICYYVKTMQTNDDQVEFYQDELINIAEKIRDLRSIPVNGLHGFEQGTASLGDILAKALEEEEVLLKKRLRIQSRVTYKKWENMFFTPFFLQVSATMEQVVYFFRVLIETRFFDNMKKVTYFDYISKHIATDKQQNFSTGSVKNKYNNPKRVTSEKVKAYFLKAVAWINDHPPMD